MNNLSIDLRRILSGWLRIGMSVIVASIVYSIVRYDGTSRTDALIFGSGILVLLITFMVFRESISDYLYKKGRNGFFTLSFLIFQIIIFLSAGYLYASGSRKSEDAYRIVSLRELSEVRLSNKYDSDVIFAQDLVGADVNRVTFLSKSRQLVVSYCFDANFSSLEVKDSTEQDIEYLRVSAREDMPKDVKSDCVERVTRFTLSDGREIDVKISITNEFNDRNEGRSYTYRIKPVGENYDIRVSSEDNSGPR